MTDITTRSDVSVALLMHAGSDEFICQAARVSSLGAASIDSSESAGLINFLMRGHHGSPFEHGFMTFLIEAPIFVWREFMRHRVGFSYNEESGRYRELKPVFYVPGDDRNLVQTGKTGAYNFEPGTEVQQLVVKHASMQAYRTAWQDYQDMLRAGVAREVARQVLPVATYSAAYVSCNPRSLMHFLGLRTKHPDALFPSFPQREIEMVAEKMESFFAQHWPLTHAAFNRNGRVSP